MSRQKPDMGTYSCSHCKVFLFQDEIEGHGCLKYSENAVADNQEPEPEIEYLESEVSEDNSENEEYVELHIPTVSDPSQWTTSETLHLIKVYKDHLSMFYERGQCNEKVWRSILTHLSESLTQKYSESKIKSKIDHVKNCYKVINEKKEQGLHTKWPLFQAVEGLVKAEEALKRAQGVTGDVRMFPVTEEQDDDDDDDEDYEMLQSDGDYEPSQSDNEENDEDFTESETLRWTGQETQQLLTAYKKHVKSLLVISSYRGKRKIWDKIASEVVMAEPRKCNPYLARMKIVNLKKTWEKHKKGLGRSPWVYYNAMTDTMKAEADALNTVLGIPVEERSPPSSSSAQEPLDTANTKRKNDEYEPAWFSQYRRDARKRHEEKMKLKMKLLTALEGFLERMQ